MSLTDHKDKNLQIISVLIKYDFYSMNEWLN